MNRSVECQLTPGTLSLEQTAVLGLMSRLNTALVGLSGTRLWE